MEVIETKPETFKEKEEREKAERLKKETADKIKTVPVPSHNKTIDTELQKGNTYLIIANGVGRYLTKSAIEVLLQGSQSSHKPITVEIPKGSPYTPPPYYEDFENCVGCGKR